jgi:hypothetical protein
MGQTGFGRIESFIFRCIWNQKCFILVQYPVLHNYYTAWFSLVRFRCLKQLKINITGQIMVSQWHYSLHTKYKFSSNAIYWYISRRGAFQIDLFITQWTIEDKCCNKVSLKRSLPKLTLFRYVTGRYVRSSIIKKSLIMESS